MDGNLRFDAGLARGILVLVVASLAACGGGGGGGVVRSNPAPVGGGGVGFTPTVANDPGLTQVNPPSIPVQGAPVSFTSPSINQHLILTNAAGALGAGLKGQGVTIGLVDSGVNRKHPALNGRVLRNFVHVGSDSDLSVDDKVGHGTVVASLAAGQPVLGNYVNADGSNSGSTDTWGGGVAQQASVVSSRIISDAPPTDDGSGQGNEIGAGQGYGDFFRGVNAELANAGARIINNSWGGLYWNDPALTTELANAWRDFVVNRGGIIVFANGNAGRDANLRGEPSDNARLPTLAHDAALERGWLTVAALDTANPTRLTDYSQECGSAMNYCLAAPGNVVFIDPDATSQANSGLYQGGGTSYAAPLVTGTAAVVWAAFPYFSNDQVRQVILGGAKDLGAAGVDPVFGWGLLDVSKAANGPSNFAWGDFSVNFTGNSVWRNPITGSGGLVKAGNGTLTLAETASYAGATRVEAGGLDIRKGLRSNLSIANGATVWASGALGGNVSNSGRFLNGASAPASIAGNFSQAATGNLGVWLGSALNVAGTAALNGQMSILGVRSGYTTTAREKLLGAASISGTFSSLKAAPNVFLDASLSYDPASVFLDIRRIDVSKAVAGMGLPTVTLASATRVEGAMQAIDAQLVGGKGPIGAAFIEGAGALQRLGSVAAADRAIRSLSGELHVAADAASLDSIDAGRRALALRFGDLAGQARLQGDWYQALGQPGQGGTVAGQFRSEGWLMGSDRRLGANVVAGFAFGSSDTDGFLGAGRDRSRERQTQARFYAGVGRGQAYALGQFGAGHYARQLRRTLFIGERGEAVASDQTGRFLVASLEAGYRFGSADAALLPHAGIDYVRLQRQGFFESGAEGFGLKTRDGSAERSLALAGLRAERRWATAAGVGLLLRGHVERQRRLSASGLFAQASFVGAEAWSPLYGEGYARSLTRLGLGLDAALSPRTTLSLGYDRLRDAYRDQGQWGLELRHAF